MPRAPNRIDHPCMAARQNIACILREALVKQHGRSCCLKKECYPSACCRFHRIVHDHAETSSTISLKHCPRRAEICTSLSKKGFQGGAIVVALDARRARWPQRSDLRLQLLPWRSVMPTYQYRCAKCGEVFEHIEHVAEHETVRLRCPKCASEAVQHQPTQFFAKTSKKS
jgi:putative FmdB family regulatory protein